MTFEEWWVQLHPAEVDELKPVFEDCWEQSKHEKGNKMSDIQAGRDEVVKNLKLAIVNANSLALRTDIEKMDELKLAISMAQASLAVFNALLEPRSVIAEIDNNAA